LNRKELRSRLVVRLKRQGVRQGNRPALRPRRKKQQRQKRRKFPYLRLLMNKFLKLHLSQLPPNL
jgi:hypothetical protein